MSDNNYSTGTPTSDTTATNIYGYQYHWIFNVLIFFVGLPINLTGGRFTTGIGSYAYIFSFVDRTTGRWYGHLFTINVWAANDNYFNSFSAQLSLHDFLALLYCDSISRSKLCFASCCHITNWYCNNSARHLCTTWGTLASDLGIFWSLIKYGSTVNSVTHK